MYRIRELKADGLTDSELNALRREKRRITHGFYVDRGLEPHEVYRRTCEAVLARLKPGAALAGPSAALAWGAPLVGPPPADVFVSNVSRGRYGRGVRVLPDTESVERGGLLVASPAATVAQCATLMSSRDALIAADAILAAGHCSAADLDAHVAAQRGRHGAARMRWVARHADGRSESPGETWTRLVTMQLGYDVVPQHHVHHDHREAYIDLLVAGTMTGIEFDGLVKYERREAQIVYERLREGRLQELGYTLVRVIWAQVPLHDQLDKRLRATGAEPVRRPRFLTW